MTGLTLISSPLFYHHTSLFKRLYLLRIPRFVRTGIPTIYHVISRTALSGFPLETAEKAYLLGLINRLSRLYFVDVFGFCVMSNHFHLVTRMYPAKLFSDDQVRERQEK